MNAATAMRQRLLSLTILAILLSGPAPLALARGAACPVPARAGISELGYTSYQEGGQLRGMSVDILQELGKRLGCPFNIEWYPRGRLFAQFYAGQVDIVMSSLRTPERDRAATWLPYTYTQFELLLTAADSGKYHSLAEFVDHGKGRLNLPRGLATTPQTLAQLERLEKAGRLEYVNDYSVVFRKMQAGRADGTVAAPAIYMLHLSQVGMLGKVAITPFTEWPRTVVGMYVLNKNTPPALRQRYADGLRAMVTDGSLQRVYEHYLGVELTRQVFAGGMRDILDAMPR